MVIEESEASVEFQVVAPGSKELTFTTKISESDAVKMSLETGRIFRLFMSWHADTNIAEIHLIPDNGIRVANIKNGLIEE